MYSPPNIQGVANGNISPYRVVKVDTTADNKFLQSALATSMNIGISQKGTRRAPGTGDDDGYAAIAGETIQIFGPGCVCMAECGGTVTRGDSVTADSGGRIVTTTTAGDIVVGEALQSGATNDIIEILAVHYRYR